jgi:YegS/Rv2252/BmrU family lipid kinase
MSQKKFVFIVNPRSAAGATRKRFETVRARFVAALGDVSVKLTERPNHATTLAREAIVAGADAVVAVGGDGTNNEVINGFFDEQGQRIHSPTAFGVVTSGTGGDFRRTFGWSTEPLDDLVRLIRFEKRRIDIGRLQCSDGKGGTVRRHFINISSLGLSGDVVNNINEGGMKMLGAKASFMMTSAATLLRYQPKRIRLSINDAPPTQADMTFVAVCNGQYFGGSMRVGPGADVSDGLFDVVTVQSGGLSFFLRHGLKIYQGTHVDVPGVDVVRATRVRAEPVGNAVTPVELDGEGPGVLPAQWDMVPAAIDLLV